MSAGVGSFRAAILLVIVTGTGLGTEFALAQEPCLSAPNAPAAAGSHWYYHTDPSTQQKCWYMRPRDQAAQTAPGQSAAPALPIARPVAGTAPALAAPAASAWTDPGEQPDAANVAWPAPPSAPPSADNAAGNEAGASSADSNPPSPAAPSAPAASNAANAANAEPTGALPAAATPEQNEPVVKTLSDKDRPAQPQGKSAILFLLAGLVGLVLAGLVLRRMVTMTVKALAGQHVPKVARQEPRLIERVATKQSMPTRIRQSPSLVPGQPETNIRISELEETLREFARRQQQRRPRPRNVFARVGAWVRS
jgi:hypothetical protein